MARSIQQFQKSVWNFYNANGRNLPWRLAEKDGSFDGYKILVSELMLQQTQVSRVILKYEQFLHRFSDMESLAAAHLGDVLRIWSGLGYNRRAKYLHDAVKQLVGVTQPWTPQDLAAIKGIGPNTAAAICVYAYDQPLVFIETNIRTVYIHYFFDSQISVADKELIPYIEQSLDKIHPRVWYWALMDYGAHLKATGENASRHSKHYAKQATFEGSLRQLRGKILRLLGEEQLSLEELIEKTEDIRTPEAAEALQREGLIKGSDSRYMLD
jgi:A/G-specific adenine glycosylase